jgi:hypothetical protein
MKITQGVDFLNLKESNEKAPPLNQEIISKMKNKTYEVGSTVKVGDRILFAFLDRSDNDLDKQYKLIFLTEDHFDFFVCTNPEKVGNGLPVLKYKS